MQRRKVRDEFGRYVPDDGSSSVVRRAVLPCRESGRRRQLAPPRIGTRRGSLTVTGYVVGPRSGVRYILVRCRCGAPEHQVDLANWRAGRSTRCNVCAKRAASDKRHAAYKSAMPEAEHRERLLNRLSAAVSRCHTTRNAKFKDYGGRGIEVCLEWYKDRAAFLRYIRTVPGWDDPALELDRKNNGGNYEPGNLRFATRSEQVRNTRRTKRKRI